MIPVALPTESFRRLTVPEHPLAVLLLSVALADLPPSWQGPVAGTARPAEAAMLLRHGGRVWVQQSLQRHGLAGLVCPDLWLWRGERRVLPVPELGLACQLCVTGVPAVAPVAVRYERVGWRGHAYRCAALYPVPDGFLSLAQRCQGAGVSLRHWAALGRRLRDWHLLGVDFPGLDAADLHLSEDGEEVRVTGVRHARFREPGLWCDAVLVALRRSLERAADLAGKPFDEVGFRAMLAAYG